MMEMKEKMCLGKKKQKMGIIISTFLILYSCKNNSDIENNSKREINHGQISTKGSIEFEFDFPDTVYRNKLYDGKIKYKGILDTVTTNVLEDANGISRYTLYSLTKSKTIDYTYDFLKKKVKLDTFGATDNRTIPFYNIKFNELGTHYIDGIINDHVLIGIKSKNKKEEPKTRYIEKEVRAAHKVIVIDRP